MKDDARRVGLYLRISRDREGAGLGVERQQEDCLALAERLGWKVVDTYRDNDVSASDRRKKRKEYLRLLADIDRGRINAIITWHLDRLHRQPAELEDFVKLIEGRDVRIQTVKAGEVNPDTPAGLMVLRMLGAAARYEVDHKRERIKRKHQQLAEAGKDPGGGYRAYGYSADRMTIIEEEAEIIRDAAKRILNGASLRSITRELNQRQIPTSVKPGTKRSDDKVLSGRWNPNSLRRMLVSPRYAGMRSHHGDVVAKAEWPPILDPKTHQALRQKLLDEARRTNGGHGNRKNLLVKVLQCGGHQEKGADHVDLCGLKMISRPAFNGAGRANVHSYICPSTRVRMKGDDVDNHVTRLMMARLTESPKLAEALKAAGDLDDEHDKARRIADDATRRLDELEEDYRRTGTRITRAQYLSSRATLESELDEAQRTLLETTGQTFLIDLPRDPEALKTMWEKSLREQPEWCWTLVESVVEKVVIGPGTRGLNKFDQGRVAIYWKV